MLLTAEAFWECGVQYQRATYMTVFKRSTDRNDTVTQFIYTTSQIHLSDWHLWEYFKKHNKAEYLSKCAKLIRFEGVR